MPGRKWKSNGSGGVRGPNSALTEFLRNEGITDAFRNRRDNDSNLGTATPETSVTPQVSPPRNRRGDSPEQVSDEEEREIIKAAARKRKIVDSDDDFEEDLKLVKKFGDIEICVDCGDEFKLTAYSRFTTGYLCEKCNELLKVRERNLKKNQLQARKTRKKVALALLNKTTVKIPSLQDICIREITKNIDQVEVLGDIGISNSQKISRILSKNRCLNDQTISLFLTPDSKSLQFWDCSNVSSGSLNKIASYCPNLESLTLFMCGQLHNDNFEYYKSNLKNLHELSLNGAFLINDRVWQEFFHAKTFTKFELRNTHRFNHDCLISLMETSGKLLTSLKLSRLDGLDSQESYDVLPHYLGSLTHLELSHPNTAALITDDLLINLLSFTGDSLKSLNLDGCSNLTDRFLIEGLAIFCPNLTHLSLRLLDKLSNEGFAKAFEEFAKVNNGNLTSVDLSKCIGLADEAVYSLLHNFGSSLVELNLNSIDKISKDFLLQISTDDSHPSKQAVLQRIENNEDSEDIYYEYIKLPLLTTCDIGFVRAVDDEILNQFSHQCPQLSILEVYGNNRCTSRAKFRAGLLVIGRQNDVL